MRKQLTKYQKRQLHITDKEMFEYFYGVYKTLSDPNIKNKCKYILFLYLNPSKTITTALKKHQRVFTSESDYIDTCNELLNELYITFEMILDKYNPDNNSNISQFNIHFLGVIHQYLCKNKYHMTLYEYKTCMKILKAEQYYEQYQKNLSQSQRERLIVQRTNITIKTYKKYYPLCRLLENLSFENLDEVELIDNKKNLVEDQIVEDHSYKEMLKRLKAILKEDEYEALIKFHHDFDFNFGDCEKSKALCNAISKASSDPVLIRKESEHGRYKRLNGFVK